MGYRTPNIDRIADEGMRFTDSYGEQQMTRMLGRSPSDMSLLPPSSGSKAQDAAKRRRG
jgi:arylsulfatase A-like enzyme